VLDPERAATAVAAGSTTDGGAVIADLDLDLDRESALTDVGPQLEGVPFLPTWSCVGQPSSVCTIVEGDGPHVLVIGDSHAWSLFATFARLAVEDGLTLSTAAAAGCPWQLELYDRETSSEGCEAFKRDLYERVLPELDPDLVVAVSDDYLGPLGSPRYEIHADGGGPPEGLDGDDGLAWATGRSLDRLTAGGARVLLVDPMPVSGALDPFACLGAAETVDECRFVAATDGRTAAVYREVARAATVDEVDLAPLVCPGHPICDPVVNGEVVRLDTEHLTPRFAVTLVDPVRRVLLDLGLLP
jgi:hypothetical protein